ncbi:MAG: hypothetical protein DRI90_10145, partial [Deltaproteobacteria bacterium]
MVHARLQLIVGLAAFGLGVVELVLRSIASAFGGCVSQPGEPSPEPSDPTEPPCEGAYGPGL